MNEGSTWRWQWWEPLEKRHLTLLDLLQLPQLVVQWGYRVEVLLTQTIFDNCWYLCTVFACVCFQCSVTCGQGKTTRQVLCVISDQEVNASECDQDDRPTTEQDCAMSQCPSRSSESRPLPSSPNASSRNNLPRSQSHQWRTGPWGAVSYLNVHSAASHHSGQAWCLNLCAKSCAAKHLKQTLEDQRSF